MPKSLFHYLLQGPSWKRLKNWFHPDLSSYGPRLKQTLHRRAVLPLFLVLLGILLVTSKLFLITFGPNLEMFVLDEYFIYFLALTGIITILHLIFNNIRIDYYALLVLVFIITTWAVYKDLGNIEAGLNRYGILFVTFLFFGLIFMPFRPTLSLFLGIYCAILITLGWYFYLQPDIAELDRNISNPHLLITWYAGQYLIVGIVGAIFRAMNFRLFLNTYLTHQRLALVEEDLKATRKLLFSSESQYIEFKSSCRYDFRQMKLNKSMELAILKTVAGFMNAYGGTLIIGIDDNHNIIGLEKDIESLRKRDIDGYELFLFDLISKNLGRELCHNVRISFIKEQGSDICLVRVMSHDKPVFVRSEDNAMYVRTGNNTQRLDTKEALEYIEKHFR